MVAESGWRERLVDRAAPSIWQWVTSVLAVLFAVQRFATSVFYSQFGVSPEDVGIGFGQSVIEGVVVFVVLVVTVNVALLVPAVFVLVGAWFDARAKAVRIRAAARRYPRRMLAYVALGLTGVVAAVTLFLLLNRVNEWVWAFGLVATIWAVMWLRSELESPFVDAPGPAGAPRDVVRRVTRLVVIVIAAILTVAFLVAPTLQAIRDAHAVEKGRSVSGFPASAWRAQRAQITWLRQPPPTPDFGSHCLMHLGQSDGVLVLYDVDDQKTLRLPGSDVVVAAVPSAASADSACPAT